MKKIIITLVFALLLGAQGFSQIISYNINQTITGPGQVTLDINNDSNNDFTFEIIALSQGLGARTVTVGSSYFLDNSTYGYPDAFNYNDSVIGPWNQGNGVLGTFNSAGQFNGMGNKYLGIKIATATGNHIGWIELYCSASRDTLIILSCGYQTANNVPIRTGETEAANAVKNIDNGSGIEVLCMGSDVKVNVPVGDPAGLSAKIFDMQGREVNVIPVIEQGENMLHLQGLPHGMYILHVQQKGSSLVARKVVF